VNSLKAAAMKKRSRKERDFPPQIAQAQEIAIYEGGETILDEGEESPFFFVILSGQVRLSHNGRKIRILDEQDIFGLENILLNKPSYYAVTALKQSRVAKYSPQALDHLIRENPRMVQNLLVSTLHQLTQTMYNLLDNSSGFTADETRMCFYNDGELVFEPETRESDFYRLVSTQGGLRVTVGGKEIDRIYKPGEFFGLPDFPAQASVKSVGESVVERYSAEDLDVLIRDYPEIARQMMRVLMDRLAGKREELV
jgi:CRP-like cAMP-binding protein